MSKKKKNIDLSLSKKDLEDIEKKVSRDHHNNMTARSGKCGAHKNKKREKEVPRKRKHKGKNIL